MLATTHYRHSNRVSLLLLPIGLAASGAIALVAAIVYAYCLVYVPVAQLAALLPLAYGAGLGALVAWLLKKSKVRSTFLTTGVTVIVVASSYLFSWIPWAYATLARAEVEVTLLDVLFPPSFLDILAGIYEYGAWTIGSSSSSSSGGSAVSGPMLGVCWLMEALFVLGSAPMAALAVSRGGVFCEKCERWCQTMRDVVRLPESVQSEAARRLDAQDVRALADLPRAQPYDNPFLMVDLDSCTGCGETHTLTLLHVSRTRVNNRDQVVEKKLVDHVFVTRDQAEWIRRGV